MQFIYFLILNIARQVDIATIIFILDFWNMYRSVNNGIYANNGNH